MAYSDPHPLEKRPIQAWPAWAAAAAVLLVLALVQANLWLWYPGLHGADEAGELSRIQFASQGHWPPLYFGGHGLTASAYAVLLKLLGPWPVQVRLLAALALALEAALLYRLASKSWGAVAGLGAVLALCVNAYSFERTCTLFSFQALPAGLLLFAATLPSLKRAQWLWGLALGLALADYESWILALPALALLSISLPAAERPPWPPLLAGFLLGAGAVAWMTLPYLHSYLGQRSQELMNPWVCFRQHFLQTILGGERQEFLLGPMASWPLWAWPWLLLGLRDAWRSQRWLFALLAFGLLPLCVDNGCAQTNRLLVAWPALFLCCGAGAAKSWQWLRGRWGRSGALLWVALPLLGLVLQARSYQREAQRWDYDVYDYSDRLSLARDFLRGRSLPLHLLTALNYRDQGEIDFYVRGLPSSPSGENWVFLFDEQLPPGPRPSWGEWREFRARPWGRALLLLKPTPGTEGRFETIQSEIQKILGPYLKTDQQADRAAAYLLAPGAKDPLLASVVLDAYLRAQDKFKWTRTDWPSVLDQVPTYNSRQRLWFSQAWETRDPSRALDWAQRTLCLDPSRESAHLRMAELQAKYPSVNFQPKEACP